MPEDTDAQCPCYERSQSLDCAANARADAAVAATTIATVTTVAANKTACNAGWNVKLTTRLQPYMPSHKNSPTNAYTHIHTPPAGGLNMRPPLHLQLPLAPPLHLGDEEEDERDDDEGHFSLQQQQQQHQHCYHQHQQQQYIINHSRRAHSCHICHSSASDIDENDVGLQAAAAGLGNSLPTALTAAPQPNVSADIDTCTQASSFDDDCFVLLTPPAPQNE